MDYQEIVNSINNDVNNTIMSIDSLKFSNKFELFTPEFLKNVADIKMNYSQMPEISKFLENQILQVPGSVIIPDKHLKDEIRSLNSELGEKDIEIKHLKGLIKDEKKENSKKGIIITKTTKLINSELEKPLTKQDHEHPFYTLLRKIRSKLN